MGLKSIYTVLDVFDLGPLDLQTSALSKCLSSPTEVGKYIMELVSYQAVLSCAHHAKVLKYKTALLALKTSFNLLDGHTAQINAVLSLDMGLHWCQCNVKFAGNCHGYCLFL